MIAGLKARIEQAPTIMDLADMQDFISALMAAPDDALRDQIVTVLQIAQTLAYAYSAGTYFEVDAATEGFFADFSAWLKHLAEIANLSHAQHAEIEAIADTFLVFPRDVYGVD